MFELLDIGLPTSTYLLSTTTLLYHGTYPRNTDEFLEEVGKEFNVTRERIRQIEAKALRKLRHPSRSKKLKDYID